ncbi:acetylglutamate kinase [Hanamia caeni]|uniref:Acetylglutamate kinase n=1 Tax=Hanamia caeni TaxID=2294116 RepID=A0A3M9NQG0_9BACT|nr:acetylglutamate kinase [Hanamia caeni]RNI40029.1 acetylglutamate kinase [Hanamia caeni]
MEKLFVIKIGGNVIDDANKLSSFLKDFSKIPDKRILVHGGGKIATSIGNKLGIVSKYIDGRRITDDETIDLVTMVYGGLVNKKIVAKLQSFNCNAIGITGADANLIPAKKREVTEIDYGWAGDIESDKINPGTWKLFLENDLTPVVAPLTHDTKGKILNTNADTIASSIAVRLSDDFEVRLIFCFEKNGVLSDVNDENSVIANINPEKFASLKKTNKLFAGMLPKIDNSFDAINKGVKEVIIGNSSQISSLINGSGGTKLSMHE